MKPSSDSKAIYQAPQALRLGDGLAGEAAGFCVGPGSGTDWCGHGSGADTCQGVGYSAVSACNGPGDGFA